MKLADAAELLERFTRGSLTRELARLEGSLTGCSAGTLPQLFSDHNLDVRLLDAALTLKAAAGEVNVLLHAISILISLPHILEAGERIESTSLGAGNTGRVYDLETDRRIAEFKFIRWRGGAETIRQNSVFKDFYTLAEAVTTKQKFLYLVDLQHPLRFFNGGRTLSSVMSRNSSLLRDFDERYGSRFAVVRDYYAYRGDTVQIVDLLTLVPALEDLLGTEAS